MDNAGEQIAQLRHQIDFLKARVDDLTRQLEDVTCSLKLETKSTTAHITALYRRIREISEYLMPVVDKVFPNLRKTQDQLNDFMDRAQRDSGGESNSPSSE